MKTPIGVEGLVLREEVSRAGLALTEPVAFSDANELRFSVAHVRINQQETDVVRVLRHLGGALVELLAVDVDIDTTEGVGFYGDLAVFTEFKCHTFVELVLP